MGKSKHRKNHKKKVNIFKKNIKILNNKKEKNNIIRKELIPYESGEIVENNDIEIEL
jgi:hypothetical protein